MPYVGTPPQGVSHGKSIKNNATYEALMRDHPGWGKAKAAAIANGAIKKGFKKGRHHSKSRKRRQH